MTELEKHLLKALEQAQAQQSSREADLQKMFEHTRQDNQSVKEALKSFLENIRTTEQIRDENLNKLVGHVSNLSNQLQDFKRQNEALTKQLQVLEMQVMKLKK